ncbi:DUF1194 domain-containing protein [Phaeobacter sp.]|uniref:DUF1194 domain-containing protein n=1 Tax=Phaeobacter sp. TaxID=1902409 RepID=UPI0025DE9981|nr:DUF1194 domain-containing protein [Phaeobacter sp.]
MRGLRAVCLSVLISCAGLASSRAQACDLALVLAVDVSGSVDAAEYRVQMDGLAAALRNGIIAEALVRAQARVLLMQWSGSGRQEVSLPWFQTSDFAAVEALAQRISTAPRPWLNFATGIGEALQLAQVQFRQVPDCRRKIVDVSGDGISNEGIAPDYLHASLVNDGITVNALAIEASEPDLTGYFFERVITGPGAFVQTASGFADYPEAIRKKLLREVAQQTAQLTQTAPNRR